MPGEVRRQFQAPPSKYGGPAPRRRRKRSKLFMALGAVGLLLVVGGGLFALVEEKAILRFLHRTSINPPNAESVPEFSNFKVLNDFKDVECIYTAKFVEALPALHERAPINLLPLSRVVVQKILRESGDYDHPTSSGYKLIVMTKSASAISTLDDVNDSPMQVLDTAVVLYPVIGNHDEVIELHLCPVQAFKKAQALWLDKSFKYVGSAIGGSEIEPGTAVSVTDVRPGYFGTSGVTFDLTFRLPGGQTAQQSINPENMGLLQPVEP